MTALDVKYDYNHSQHASYNHKYFLFFGQIFLKLRIKQMLGTMVLARVLLFDVSSFCQTQSEPIYDIMNFCSRHLQITKSVCR